MSELYTAFVLRAALVALLLLGQDEEINRLLAAKDFAKAAERLEALAKDRPASGWVWVSLGYARTELRQWDEAERAFATALEREPAYPWTLYNRGRMNAMRGRMEEARRDLERSLEKHPGVFPQWTRYFIGLTHQPTDPKTALDWYERAFERDPAALEGELFYWRNAGFCTFRLARWNRAIRIYREGLAKFPDDPWLWHMLAVCHCRLGEGDKARECGRKAEGVFKNAKADHATEIHPPFRGRWKVIQGNDGPYTHWGLTGKFAFDFAACDEKGALARPDPKKLEDWFAWDAEVLAVADGEVVAAVDGFADRLGDNREDPGEGNHVVVRHAERESSAVFHLRLGSVAVKPGQKVKRGEILGRCGSSGYAIAPHIHFVLLEDPTSFLCRPCAFTHAEVGGKAAKVPAEGDVVVHPAE